MRVRQTLTVAVASVAVLGSVLAAQASAENTMALQPDGKIVLAGQAHQAESGLSWPALIRFNADGQVDRRFAASGGLLDFRDQLAAPYSAVAATSGAVYAAGESVLSYRTLRFENDGDVDANFGTEGVAPPDAEPVSESGTWVFPSVILPQADGELFVGGSIERRTRESGTAFVDQLRTDGAPAGLSAEISGTRGDIGLPSLRDMVQAPDGSLIAVGSLNKSFGTQGLLARLAPGSRTADPAFAPGAGVALGESATSIAATQQGGYVVAANTAGAPLVARFDQDGKLDPSFGKGGTAGLPQLTNAVNASARAVAAMPNGGVLVAGQSLEPCSSPSADAAGCWGIFVARLDSLGGVDASFGEGGIVRIPKPGDDGVQPGPIDLAILADGSSLVSMSPGSRLEADFLLARIGIAGNLDGSFGRAGIVTASPCEGTIAALRKTGCLSHAFLNFHVEGFGAGKPRGRLRINSDNLLDPMAAVAIVLPRQLRGEPKLTKRLQVVTYPRREVGRRVKRGRVSARFGLGARGVAIGLRPGILRRARTLRPGHKLVFRVIATFKDGSTQRISVRMAP